jgi:type IV pilus assembly protein PilM
MFRLTRSHLLPIGVDIGCETVKLLQLEVTGTTLKVVAAARQHLPEEARRDSALRLPLAMQTINEMLRENRFKGRQIVAALPRDIVHSKNLRLPQMPAEELRGAVEFEARNIFKFENDPALVQYLSAGEVRSGNEVKNEVLVLAARNEDVDNFVEQLHRSRCVIESLDWEPQALYRSIERFIRRREDEQEVHVLVDVGSRHSQVVIGKGHDISFFKAIDMGGAQLHEAVAKKLDITVEEARALRRRLLEQNMDDDTSRDPVRQAVLDASRSLMEELAREISLCLRYYSVTFRGFRPNKVRLVGGEASDAQLISILGSALTVPVEPGRPLHSVDTSVLKPADRRGFMNEWAIAFGLSLKTANMYFGARDGKQRATPAPTSSGAAEVVNLEQAAIAASSQAPVGLGSNGTGKTPAEAVHA